MAEQKGSGEFKELIKNLRIRLEKSVEMLKKLEEKGDNGAAHDAIWLVYGIWNGDEYGDLEKILKEKGYKCVHEELNEYGKKKEMYPDKETADEVLAH